MYIMIFIIMIFTAFNVYKNYRYKFAYVITLKFIGISLALIVAIIYTSKMTVCRFNLRIDYYIYQLFQSIGMPLETISRFYNICFAVVMVSDVICLRLIDKFKSKFFFLLFIPVLFFIVWLDPAIQYDLYIGYHTMPNILTLNASFINLLCGILFILYIILPLIFLAQKAITTNAVLIKNTYLITMITVAICDAFVVYVFVLGLFKSIWVTNINVSCLPIINKANSNYFFVSFILFICLSSVIILLIKYQPFGMFSDNNVKKSRKKIEMLDNNISMLLHIYKNAFLTIGQQLNLIEYNNSIGNTEAVSKGVEIGLSTVDNAMESIVNRLKMLNTSVNNIAQVDIIECLEKSVDKFEEEIGIFIDKKIGNNSCKILADKHHLTEAFNNIIRNAIEATQQTDRQPEIKISVSYETDFYFIEIIDNGIGMSKKEIHNVFELFYSTKPCIKCGGVGLNYTKNVIESCGGRLNIVSSYGNGTNVQIVFPKINKFFGKTI